LFILTTLHGSRSLHLGIVHIVQPVVDPKPDAGALDRSGPMAPLLLARRESALRQRRGRDRLRAEGAGRRQDLVFPDRVLVTLEVLRLQVPHAALAVIHGVDRSTVTRAVREIRPRPSLILAAILAIGSLVSGRAVAW
jgi:hypothetical protein